MCWLCSEDATDFLAHAATRARYKPWELEEDLWEQMEYELAHVAESPNAQLMEELHAAAYRGGNGNGGSLGHSLFAQTHLLRSFGTPALQRYVRTQWTPNRTALVAIGVRHKRVLEWASEGKFDWARDAASPQQMHNDDALYYANEFEPAPAPHEQQQQSGAELAQQGGGRFGGGERRMVTGDPTVHAALVTEAAGYMPA